MKILDYIAISILLLVAIPFIMIGSVVGVLMFGLIFGYRCGKRALMIWLQTQ